MHEVLVNRLGGLSLPRKSVVRLTDRPDMTLDVYRGRKTTKQQQQNCCQGVSIRHLDIFPYKTFCLILIFMMFTAGFEPIYVTEVQVKVFHSLLAVGAMDVRVPLYLGHS